MMLILLPMPLLDMMLSLPCHVALLFAAFFSLIPLRHAARFASASSCLSSIYYATPLRCQRFAGLIHDAAPLRYILRHTSQVVATWLTAPLLAYYWRHYYALLYGYWLRVTLLAIGYCCYYTRLLPQNTEILLLAAIHTHAARHIQRVYCAYATYHHTTYHHTHPPPSSLLHITTLSSSLPVSIIDHDAAYIIFARHDTPLRHSVHAYAFSCPSLFFSCCCHCCFVADAADVALSLRRFSILPLMFSADYAACRR